MSDFEKEIETSDDVVILNNNTNDPVEKEQEYNPQKAKDETTRNLAFVVLAMLGIFMLVSIGILFYIYFKLPSSFEEKILNILENILIASLSILSGLASTVVTFYFVSRDKQQ